MRWQRYFGPENPKIYAQSGSGYILECEYIPECGYILDKHCLFLGSRLDTFPNRPPILFPLSPSDLPWWHAAASAQCASPLRAQYFNLVGDEDDIGSERFNCTFSYYRNAIGLAAAYASTIRAHLSVHGTVRPLSAASVCPRSAADCLIRSAVDMSHPRQQGTPRAGTSVASDPA